MRKSFEKDLPLEPNDIAPVSPLKAALIVLKFSQILSNLSYSPQMVLITFTYLRFFKAYFFQCKVYFVYFLPDYLHRHCLYFDCDQSLVLRSLVINRRYKFRYTVNVSNVYIDSLLQSSAFEYNFQSSNFSSSIRKFNYDINR